MAYTERDLERFQKNELKPGDTFNFNCDMCGNCCRKRREPILLTGFDIFRAAQILCVTMEEVIEKNLEGYIGPDSHLPLYVLTERLDGSCRFLRKGKCLIHKSKPVVCALFPLGRMYDARDNSFHYFVNAGSCHPNRGPGRAWTLDEWLAEFNIRETECMTLAWNKLITALAEETCRMRKEDIRGELYEALRRVMYLGYDTGLSYIDQVESRIGEVQKIFGKK